jgi:hypothetical protein
MIRSPDSLNSLPRRVLHLIDGRSRYACGMTWGLIAQTISERPGDSHECCVIGQVAPLPDVTRRLAPIAHLSAPGGMSIWNGALLSRFIHSRPRSDEICAWSIEAARLACRVRRDEQVRLNVRLQPDAREIRQLRRLAQCQGLTIIAASESVAQQLTEAGVARSMIEVTPPVVDPEWIDASARHSIREQWPLEDDRRDEQVVALLGDPISEADAMMGLWVAGLVAETGRAVRLLVSPRARGLHRAQCLTRAMGHPQRILIDDRLDEPWRILPACDIGLLLASRANDGGCVGSDPSDRRVAANGGLALQWALAGGLVVVGEDAAMGEATSPTIQTTSAGRPRELARLLMRRVDRRIAGERTASA